MLQYYVLCQIAQTVSMKIVAVRAKTWVKVFRNIPEFRILGWLSTESRPQNAELRW